MNNFYSQQINQQLPPCSVNNDTEAPYTRKRFSAFLYCLLFSRVRDGEQLVEQLLETIQKRSKTFPCVRSLRARNEWCSLKSTSTLAREFFSSIKFGDHKTSFRYKNSLLSTTRQPKQRSHQIKIVICAKQSE